MADIDSALVVRLEATLSKFEKQMARARKVGSDSANDLERRFQRSNRQIAVTADRASGALQRMSNISGRGRFMIQNVANQIGDVAVQMGSGTSASRALGQQLPQLLGGFGALGAILGTVAAVALPAAAFAFSSLGEEATTVEEALKDVEAIAKTLEGPMAILQMSGQELADVYGEAAQRVRDFATVQAELAVAQATARLGDQIQILDDVVDGFIISTEEGLAFEKTLERINGAFGTTRDQAVVLENELQNIFLAARTGTFEDGRAALQSFLDKLREMDLPLANIPEDLRIAINETINLSNAMDAAARSATTLAAEVAGMTTGTPLFAQPGGTTDLLPPGPKLPSSPSTATRRSGGSSGSSQARSDAMERDRLLRETRTDAEAYADELARLNDLHARGVIDGDLFQRALDQMHEGFDANSRAAERLGDAAAEMFTSIIDGSSSARDALTRLLQQFAGNALQSTLGGAISTIVGAAAPSLAGSLPSFAGGGYTGGGARSGGVDGRGGFPAILHPNETVTDHARGGGGMQVVINNNSPAQVTAQRGPGGRLDVTIDEQVAAAITAPRTSAAMQRAYGLRRTT